MTRFLVTTIAALILASSPTLADTKLSDADSASLKAAAEKLGFSGGEYEKEDEAAGVYEIDDAKSANGMQYDLKFDKDFNLISATRD